MPIRTLVISAALALAVAAPAIPEQAAWPNDHIQPSEPPTPTYPAEAAMRGLVGSCEVYFDVDEAGTVVNPWAVCTNTAFCKESVRAVGLMKYAPRVEDGVAVRMNRLRYPLVFTMFDTPDDYTFGEFKNCTARPVA